MSLHPTHLRASAAGQGLVSPTSPRPVRVSRQSLVRAAPAGKRPGTEPLDAEVVRNGFGGLAADVTAATGTPTSAEQVASGFLRIAVANMASAIKKISVQRGRRAVRLRARTGRHRRDARAGPGHPAGAGRAVADRELAGTLEADARAQLADEGIAADRVRVGHGCTTSRRALGEGASRFS